MILAPKDPSGADWNEAVLHSLGASTISHTLNGIEIAPDIDLTGYAAGLASQAAAALIAYANQKQWALAEGGYTVAVGGQSLTFSTSIASMTLMNGKFLRLTQANPPTTISWQFASGFVPIAAADFAKAAIAVSDFVQATFDTLDAVFAAIKAGTISTTAEVDAAAWPSAVAAS